MKLDYQNPAYESVYDFPPFDRPPIRTLLVATTPRSGSSLFAFLCRQTGAYGFPLEYYTAINAEVIRKRLGLVDPGLATYTGALTRIRTSRNGVFGFKLHYDELPTFRNAGGLVLPITKVVRVVLLERKDRLAQSISLLVAAKTNQWIDLPGYRMAADGEPTYDRASIRETMTNLDMQHEQWRSFLEHNGYPVLPIAYEDMLNDCGGTFRNLSRFLDVPEGNVPTLESVEISRQGSLLKRRWKARFLAGD